MAKGVKAADQKSLRIHQALARKLGLAILTGKYQPGDNLGGEIERSAELSVSRTAYREAVRLLTAKGLIESKPKAGTHVTPRARWNLLDPEILAWMFSGEPDETFVRDLFELRAIIEPAAAGLAAKRRTPAQLESMQEALEGMRKYGLASARGREADQDFHHAVLEATHNEPLASLASSVGAAVTWTTYFKQRQKKTPRDPLPDHEAVFDAIAASNPKHAHAAMIELVARALADMGPQHRSAAKPRDDRR